ncbi:MAG: thioesterase family protein [Proteobacteria bacterium]|nr:thioesterase family protein [Pseudomonadota bacterium]
MAEPIDVSKPFSLGYPIRFTHTDPAGFVFFPRYFEMLQAVTEDWFTHRLGIKFADLIMIERVGQPTAHTECDFVKPCRLGETLDIALILEQVGNSSMKLHYIGTVEGEVRVRARSVQVMVDMDTGKPVPFSDTLRTQLEAYLTDVIPPTGGAP